MEQGGQAAVFVVIQPTPNGIAVEAKQVRNVTPKACLPTRQQVERMEALMLDRVALLDKELFEFISRFMNDWNGSVHQMLATITAHRSDCR